MPQDKLTAVRIKQQNGQYGPQIPVGARAENVKYDNEYSVKEVLGNVKTNVAPLQEQIDNIDTSAISGAVINWLEDNPGALLPTDKTLSIADAPADAQQAGKVVTINSETDGQATKAHFNTTNQVVNIATMDDVIDPQIIAPEFATASAYTTGDYIMHNAKLYRAKQDSAANDGWIATRWQEVAVMTVMSEMADELTNVKTQLTIQDDHTNHLLGLMNYGYDTPADLPHGSSASTYISVKRDGTRVLLDGSTVSAQWVGKLNNDVQRAASSTTVKALTNGTVFTSGHTFRVTSKKISGTGTYNNNDYIPVVAVYKKGTSTTVGSIITQTSNECCREFTADGSEYMICLRCENGGGFTNMLVEVTMQDMADESVYELINKMDNTVPEGTAWN